MSQRMVTQDDLSSKLARTNLSPTEVLEGIRECFILTHRAFIQRRQPEQPIEEVDTFSAELVDEVFDNENLNPRRVNLSRLLYAVKVLNERFEFAEDPELADIHEGVVSQLVEKLSA